MLWNISPGVQTFTEGGLSFVFLNTMAGLGLSAGA
jgi:hypothetical protein